MKIINFFSLIIALSIISTSCNKSTNKIIPTDCTNLHWTYDKSKEGPAHWKEICINDTACAGIAQSPINLVNATKDATLTAIERNYKKSAVHILDNGHTEYFTYDSTSTINFEGRDYSLLQFHTHTPSEHTINGVSFPMEMHFVHRNAATGKLAVIGVMFTKGAENPTLAKFISHLPKTPNAKFDLVSDTFNALDLQPTAPGYYTYSGSLTTPPCSEIVTWLVMKTPMTASAEQIAAFKAIEGANNRPLQALNGRKVNAFN